ncbi:hypothetical protein H257_04433 [Aphanomyces astaci]|uniref:Uncharacterized protein n=1 Tax=Aphanomyces astaci TaxID=112090 RepID=W4GVW6_APHAT|nr:hypothetical protein H257_04433 [Aphanomyces astaci]ETV83822.1 hypothetical protein H257_04433 [Aphanomyces astaci]|eukprot:XP_009827252.1 hypothetical protein H257_04433 [Aphanomyces astaci]
MASTTPTSSGNISQDDDQAMTLKKPPPPKKRTNKLLVELLPLQHDEVDLEQQRARRMAHSTSDVAR